MALANIQLFGDWKKAIKLMSTAPMRFGPAAHKALTREGIRAQKIIRTNIQQGPPPPQSQQTRDTGGSGKPLNRDGTMRQAVNVVHAGLLDVFIGIPRSEGAFNIAVVHEEGKVIVQPLTNKMRAYLMAKLSGDPPAGGGGPAKQVLVTVIPARPFVAPAYAEMAISFDTRFASEFARALRGDYGRI